MKKNKINITFLLAVIMTITLSVPGTLLTQGSAAKAAAIRLNKTSVKAYEGDKIQLKLGNIKKNVTWTSNKKRVAAVTNKGKVICKKAGTAKITAAYKKKKYTCNVRVMEKQEANKEISVRGAFITIGEKEESIAEKFGTPSRIETSLYGERTYIYNDDYTKLLMIYITEGRVAGLYTESLDFKLDGASMNDADRDYLMNNYRTTFYTDKLESQKIYGIRITDIKVQPNSPEKMVMADLEKQILDLTNSIRVRNGLEPLKWSDKAALSARKHSEDMVKNEYFDHIDPSGGDMGDRMSREGIVWTMCGENIAAGQRDSAEVVYDWFMSPGHRMNLLEKGFEYLGAGAACDKEKSYIYYTQNFYR